MPQNLADFDVWELRKATHEVLPLVVLSAGVQTTNYTVTCVPFGADATSFSAPTTANGVTGYLVDGETLGKGTFEIVTKINAGAEQVVRTAAILKIV